MASPPCSLCMRGESSARSEAAPHEGTPPASLGKCARRSRGGPPYPVDTCPGSGIAVSCHRVGGHASLIQPVSYRTILGNFDFACTFFYDVWL